MSCEQATWSFIPSGLFHVYYLSLPVGSCLTKQASTLVVQIALRLSLSKLLYFKRRYLFSLHKTRTPPSFPSLDSMARQPTCKLFQLPLELRLEVYRCLGIPFDRLISVHEIGLVPAISQTCRSLRYEYSNAFFRLNRLVVSNHFSLKRLLYIAGPQNVSRIRHLRFLDPHTQCKIANLLR